jgi:asparagine synthase (glutamine-hydrolysing)
VTAVAGVFSWDGRPRNEDAARMYQRIEERRKSRTSVWSDECATLATFSSRQWPEPPERWGVAEVDGVVVALTGAVYDFDPRVSTSPASPGTPALAQLVARAYHLAGPDFPDLLDGEFSLLLWDTRERQGLVVTDRFATRPLYAFAGAGFLAVSSDLSALLAVGLFAPRLNEMRLVQLLVNYREEGGSTLYQGVESVQPASVLRVSSSGDLCRLRYWVLGAEPSSTPAPDDYAAEYRRLLGEAVAQRLKVRGVATTLSGGLDSSSVTGLAATLTRQRGDEQVLPISVVFSGTPQTDETTFMDAVDRHNDLRSLRIDVEGTPVLDSSVGPTAAEDEPVISPTAVVNTAIYEAAGAHGRRYILEGFGGDEVVSYGLARLTELAFRLRWISLWREMSMLSERVPANRRWMLEHLVLQPAFPLWARPPVRRVLERFRPPPNRRDLLRPGLVQRVTGAAGRAELYAPRPQARTSRADYIQGMRSPVHNFSMAVLDRLAAPHGVETRYPFFSRRLVDFCLELPADQRLDDGWTRVIARRALGGVLPEETRWRSTKASLSPYVVKRLAGVERNQLQDALVDAPGRIVDYVDLDAVRELLRGFDHRPEAGSALALWRLGVWSLWLRNSAA